MRGCLLEVKHGVTLVPSAAVQRGAKGTFVYVVKDDKTVAVRPVTVGVSHGEDASINSGLAPDELVVVDGTEKLREGSKVEVRNRNEQPAAQSRDAVRHRTRRPEETTREPVAAVHPAAGGDRLDRWSPFCWPASSPIASCRFPRFPRSITRPFKCSPSIPAPVPT